MGSELKPCVNTHVRYGNPKHGAWTRHKSLYMVWNSMIHRCYDESREKYSSYGGRGITVCDEWKDPNTFIDWAESNGYENGLQLDRIDNDGSYCPNNCRWVSRKENCRNTRRNKFITLDGKTKTIAEWCETLPISQYTMYHWYREYGKEGCEERVKQRIA